MKTWESFYVKTICETNWESWLHFFPVGIFILISFIKRTTELDIFSSSSLDTSINVVEMKDYPCQGTRGPRSVFLAGHGTHNQPVAPICSETRWHDRCHGSRLLIENSANSPTSYTCGCLLGQGFRLGQWCRWKERCGQEWVRQPKVIASTMANTKPKFNNQVQLDMNLLFL